MQCRGAIRRPLAIQRANLSMAGIAGILGAAFAPFNSVVAKLLSLVFRIARRLIASIADHALHQTPDLE